MVGDKQACFLCGSLDHIKTNCPRAGASRNAKSYAGEFRASDFDHDLAGNKIINNKTNGGTNAARNDPLAHAGEEQKVQDNQTQVDGSKIAANENTGDGTLAGAGEEQGEGEDSDKINEMEVVEKETDKDDDTETDKDDDTETDDDDATSASSSDSSDDSDSEEDTVAPNKDANATAPLTELATEEENKENVNTEVTIESIQKEMQVGGVKRPVSTSNASTPEKVDKPNKKDKKDNDKAKSSEKKAPVSQA
jgi:hypothetical protein